MLGCWVHFRFLFACEWDSATAAAACQAYEKCNMKQAVETSKSSRRSVLRWMQKRRTQKGNLGQNAIA